jgi:2-polyprenyl-3-methyl-5-hydroxy-6-metoxy-1,4-benzoquinol methylase
MMNNLTKKDIVKVASEFYRGGSLITRIFQSLRIYICPLEVLIEKVRKGSRVLDIGCGAGLILGLLAYQRKVTEGVGWDISKQAIAMAKMMQNRLENNGANLTFVQSDSISGLPVGLFEVVLLVDVLHHVPPAEQEKMIETAVSRVAPGGILLYKDIGERPRWRALLNRLHDLVVANQWINYRAVKAVEAWMLKCGFEVAEAQSYDRLWYHHELRIFQRRL